MVQTPRFVTVEQIRIASGVPVKFISDEHMQELISQTEFEIEKFLNTSFTPLTVMELREGDGSERMVLNNNPILKLRALKIDEADITVSNVKIDKQPAILWLSSGAEKRQFTTKSTERNLIRIKYDHGVLENSTNQTSSTAATTAGDSVTISVSSSSNFTAGKHIEIVGFDSQFETALISDIPNGTSIEVDNLATTHESGSLITEQRVPKIGERFMIVGTSLAAVARVVGQSFDEITGYSLGDMSVQKGEPYTQWRETANQLRKEWAELNQKWRTRTAIA